MKEGASHVCGLILADIFARQKRQSGTPFLLPTAPVKSKAPSEIKYCFENISLLFNLSLGEFINKTNAGWEFSLAQELTAFVGYLVPRGQQRI